MNEERVYIDEENRIWMPGDRVIWIESLSGSFLRAFVWNLKLKFENGMFSLTNGRAYHTDDNNVDNIIYCIEFYLNVKLSYNVREKLEGMMMIMKLGGDRQ